MFKSVVFSDEFHVFFERDSATVVLINLREVPVNHLLSDWDFQWSEGIFHQSSEFSLINELVFITFFILVFH